MRKLLFFIFLIAAGNTWSQDKAKIEKLLEFVKVEGGPHTIYSDDFEVPPIHVQLSSFYMQKTEVTQELWETVMGSNPSSDKSGKNFPVTDISWLDCQVFVEKLNKITNKKYRLPTEAEWEYAALGGKLSKGYKYAGSNEIDEVAWYRGNSYGKTKGVAEKKPNELGLYDMSGNVWEWCSDWYGEDRQKEERNPKGPEFGNGKVIRGGNCFDLAWGCILSGRGAGNLDNGNGLQGFRLLSPVE
jgi:formylglycine-generating enzyme required for sulfatase activity